MFFSSLSSVVYKYHKFIFSTSSIPTILFPGRAEQSRNRGSINMVVSMEKGQKKEEELTGVEHDHHQYNNGNAQLQIQMSTQDSVSGFSIPTNEIVQQDDDSDEEYLEFDGKKPDEDVEVQENGVVMMLEEEMVFDPRDEGTSDFWIRRHPSLVRLTGKHPFNCEPPLKSLMENGFITPLPLHYVRNHGYVPKATWDNWSVEVCDAETTDDLLVKRPTRFSMQDLVRTFPYHELPVTLVCAGNRRKEQNMVKQTIGFNWGAAGISTAVWRGVRLRDVLKRCGVVSDRGLYVWFEGEEDLPGGGGSKYGTSLALEVAMDPSADIMLAYKMNGQVLPPDHGFPVRMIIPGFIGGRMVKWLRRVTVARQESQNHYHFKDNRVLPSVVHNADIAQSQGWWYKPEYIINELNINSVITTPCHDDMVPINSATMQEPYIIRGYAYSGGGKKVTRVEVTLDGGETWKLCNVDHPEKPNRYGKYWCWCFWSVEVQVLDLLGAKAIAVRAWDQSQNTQPEKLIWNLMGMMNNCWFQVKINICRPNKGEVGIVFEHPTQPGNTSGGWMARQKHVESSDTQVGMKKSFSAPSTNTTKQYSLSNVKNHNSRDSAWIVVHGSIYDCTPFIDEHPGGVDSILINAGTDCTEEFDAIHSDKAKAMLEMYRIGELITTGYTSDASVHGGSSSLQVLKELSSSPPPALIPHQKIPSTLVSKISVSHNVRLFRFALPYNDQTLGLPVGKHIFLCATIDGKRCMRAYTPTSKVDQVGHFDLVVKVYNKDIHPNFPKGGLMTQHLDSLPLGSSLDIKGPLGHIEYKGQGNFLVNGNSKWARRLAMVAGGTGITPIYQVMQAILADPKDVTEMWLVYANQTEDDVLLKDEIDGWSREHSDRVRVWYVVGKAKREGWPYSIGHVSEDVLKDHIPPWSNDTLVLACGPPSMIRCAVEPGLNNLGYDKSSLLVF